MNFAKAVARQEASLKARGYDGLYWSAGSETCGCGIGDLRPCGELKTGCVPADERGDGFYPARHRRAEAQP